MKIIISVLVIVVSFSAAASDSMPLESRIQVSTVYNTNNHTTSKAGPSYNENSETFKKLEKKSLCIQNAQRVAKAIASDPEYKSTLEEIFSYQNPGQKMLPFLELTFESDIHLDNTSNNPSFTRAWLQISAKSEIPGIYPSESLWASTEMIGLNCDASELAIEIKKGLNAAMLKIRKEQQAEEKSGYGLDEFADEQETVFSGR